MRLLQHLIIIINRTLIIIITIKTIYESPSSFSLCEAPFKVAYRVQSSPSVAASSGGDASACSPH